VALFHATQLLQKDARLAAEQAAEILASVPGHPHALLVLGAARRLTGDAASAVAILEDLAKAQPRSVPVHLELAVARAELGAPDAAIVALQTALRVKPDSAEAWRLLADQFDACGDGARADAARAHYLQAATKDPRLLEAAAALVANDLPRADARLRAHLATHPSDVAALRMLAEVAARLRRYADAETLLERCLQLAPSFDAARHNYAVVLHRQSKSAEALPQIERLLAKAPRNPGYRNLQAAILAQLGDYDGSIAVYERVLAEFPGHARVWMSYGHALKTAGRGTESIAAYRRAIALEPLLGEAYWSLANLKTLRFAPADVAAMRAALASEKLKEEDRLHFEFALGKALEDEGAYAESFTHYAEGNTVRRRMHPYDADAHTDFVRRSRALFTTEFFAARTPGGARAADPIFIVGLPRAGSTLLEQILASHPQVEGTMELPNLPMLARELAAGTAGTAGAAGAGGESARFLDAVAALTPARRRELGERYLAETRLQRRSAAPFFIDKMPNNCLYVGLIHLILPNARIIDARRHPLGCGLSAFKQHFARGQNFSYSLGDLGRYYADYVGLMAHFDAVLPGRVHRVIYESLIENTEAEVVRLLDHCGLPFEPQCLAFHENARAVRTASSEQVRRPIYRDGLEQWRHYETWLGPLQAALGPVLDAYPEVPPLL
jgi:predicted Zn-dependent protease